jgi:hypothetical protein
MLAQRGGLRGDASLVHPLGFHHMPKTLRQRGFVQWRDRLESLVGKRPPTDGAEWGHGFDRAQPIQPRHEGVVPRGRNREGRQRCGACIGAIGLTEEA